MFESTVDEPHSRRAARMPAHKYAPMAPIPMPDRRWPDRTLTRAPRWCSVDLRDGNQALVQPMGRERKLRFFDALVAMGFREIEVGFPSASQTDFEFVRELIEEGRVPEDVTLQVLTPARDAFIERTFESIRGARRAIVHLYNSVSPIQREVVFGLDRAGIRDIATAGAHRVAEEASRCGGTEIQFSYSPESFSATELDFSVDVCEAVMDVWAPTRERPVILNLPATVEMAMPNVFADQVEWFCGHVTRRDCAVVSVHPHNDRGCAVAAAELALLAGADRVEGTLFGNGERTGNVDIVTLALNLLTQGVDPGLDLSELDSVVEVAEYCNRLPVHPRHPYAGKLVYTAFSGSHQDAIKKGLAHRSATPSAKWDVPYLPLDPADVGRSYEAVIRVNSQSGKGGVAYLLERDEGLHLPRWVQVEFSGVVQAVTDATGDELTSEAVKALFEREYLAEERALGLVEHRSHPLADGGLEMAAVLRQGERSHTLRGRGRGPIDAFMDALHAAGITDLEVRDFREQALGGGSDALAVAYVWMESAAGDRVCGVGKHASIVTASLCAIVGAIRRHRQLAASRGDAAQEEASEDLGVDEPPRSGKGIQALAELA